MQYLIILIMCVLASSKMSFQTAFGKKSVKNTSDAVFFNELVFLFSAALFLPKIIGCSPEVWIYAAITAVLSVAFQLTYTKALSVGNVSLTVLIVNFSMVINVLVSYFFYNEPMSHVRLLGIILTVIAFIICTDFKEGKSSEKKWMIFTIAAMLASSGASVSQKVFGASPFKEQSQAFVSSQYLVAAVITLLVYLFLKRKGRQKTFKTGKRAILFAMAVGFSLALFQAVNTYALSAIDGTFLFPTYAGGTVIFSTLSGVFIFKDTLNTKQILSIIIGIIAVVLMNF